MHHRVALRALLVAPVEHALEADGVDLAERGRDEPTALKADRGTQLRQLGVADDELVAHGARALAAQQRDGGARGTALHVVLAVLAAARRRLAVPALEQVALRLVGISANTPASTRGVSCFVTALGHLDDGRSSSCTIRLYSGFDLSSSILTNAGRRQLVDLDERERA